MATGYSGPAVADGRVLVTDWQRATGDDGKPRRATRAGIPGTERVLCLAADDGKLLWQHQYDCPYTISYPNGPRTTPTVEEDRAYVLGAMGDLKCLATADGTVHWEKNLMQAYRQEPPVWGCAAHPLVDGDLLYCLVGGHGSAVVALNKHTRRGSLERARHRRSRLQPADDLRLAGTAATRRLAVGGHLRTRSRHRQATLAQAYPIDIPVQRPAVNIITVRKTATTCCSSPASITAR